MRGKKKGYSLIAAIFIMLVMSVFSLGIVTMVSSDAVSSVRNYQSNQVFYIAQAAAERYLMELKGLDDWTLAPWIGSNFFGGWGGVAQKNTARDTIDFTIEAFKIVGTEQYRRRLSYKVKRSNPGFGIFNDYAIYWAGGGDAGVNSFLADNTRISGDIFVNSPLILAPGARVMGDVHSTGDVLLQEGATVDGAILEDQPLPDSLPTLDPSIYDNLLALAEVAPMVDKTYDGTPMLAGGDYFLKGNLTIKSDAVISTNGPVRLIVNGLVTIGNNVKLGDNITIISNGKLIAGSGLQQNKNGCFYSNEEIFLGNNFRLGVAAGPGEGMAILSRQKVVFNSEGQFFGFVYAQNEFQELGNSTLFEGNLMTSTFLGSSLNATFNVNPNLVDFESVGMVPVAGGGGPEMSVDSWTEDY